MKSGGRINVYKFVSEFSEGIADVPLQLDQSNLDEVSVLLTKIITGIVQGLLSKYREVTTMKGRQSEEMKCLIIPG